MSLSCTGWIMKALHVFFLTAVAEFAMGQYKTICQTQPVKAEEGGDVKLPCHLHPPVNVSTYTVEWKRVDRNKVVHLYRHRQDDTDPQIKQYKNRTKLNHEELSTGILDLQIFSVQLSDSGKYICNVPKLKTRCNITLNVEKKDEAAKINKPNSCTTRPPLEELKLNNTDPSSDSEQLKSVVVVCGVIVAAVIIAVIVLVKCGVIKNCVERHRGKKEADSLADGSTVKMLDIKKAEGS